MRWFGDDWGAPICQATDHAPTPIGVVCAHMCGHDIRPGDIGLLIPFCGDYRQLGRLSSAYVQDKDGIIHLVYHLVCFFDEIGVRGKTHN